MWPCMCSIELFIFAYNLIICTSSECEYVCLFAVHIFNRPPKQPMWTVCISLNNRSTVPVMNAMQHSQSDSKLPRISADHWAENVFWCKLWSITSWMLSQTEACVCCIDTLLNFSLYSADCLNGRCYSCENTVDNLSCCYQEMDCSWLTVFSDGRFGRIQLTIRYSVQRSQLVTVVHQCK